MDRLSVVLADAEDKQGKSLAVRRWLGKLKHSVNHAEDLLDELDTECLRLKLDYEFQQKQTQPEMKLSLNLTFMEKFMPNLKEVTVRLEYCENQIQRLGLQKLDSKEKYAYRAPSSPMVDKSHIFVSDDEKEKLLHMLLSDGADSDVSVIAITGMGGIGKTTLSQLVYNDDQVKKKFLTRAWVCVSEEYDPLRVTRDLLRQVNSAIVDDKDDLNHLQAKLTDMLEGHVFIIIIDDMWNENYNDWSSLKIPLRNGSRGSKIVVTTRNQNIALMMQSEHFLHMQPMPEHHSWCLFKSHAFINKDYTSLHEFEKIGKKIVTKCKGLPLAIQTVAVALGRERDINAWHDFLSREDWATSGDILPALSLSYKHLPSHLKGCFAFCALFHKEIPFYKDEVVQLWMANDLVKPSTQRVGRRYFEELISLSFFEWVDGKLYIMHDLINDLARFVAGDTCIRLEDYQATGRHLSIQQENELPQELLHISYLSNSNQSFERFSEIAQAQSLRTYLPIHQHRYQRYITSNFFSDICPRFQRLRALNLSGYLISVVPDSIGDLKHLRLLNLASTNIIKVPNAITRCLNLQTLVLANCKELVELPEDMRLLINLHHLDVRGVRDPLIEKMATWLRYIQNISVVVDKIHGSVLEHLDKLQLCHSLKIIGLGGADVVTIEGAMLSLKDKYCIENLTFEWSGVADCSEDELKKFTKLQPHTNTKKLSIMGYKGTRFPNWIGDSAFSNMESLCLEDCKNCSFLPPLGLLTGLKKLRISGMDGISEIGEELYGDASTSKPFQVLEELEFSNCNNILSFPEGGLAAPNLKRLTILYCKKMKSLPSRMHTQLPLLTELEIGGCSKIECFPEGGLPSSLETLQISNCSKMRICQTDWGLQRLQSLTIMNLSGFEDTLFPEEGWLPSSLQKLSIFYFSNLESLNDQGLRNLGSLRSLYIWDCQNLKYLPQQKFSSSLSEVGIVGCELVESFPEGLASSLSSLRVVNCPKLAACIEVRKGKIHPKFLIFRV